MFALCVGCHTTTPLTQCYDESRRYCATTAMRGLDLRSCAARETPMNASTPETLEQLRAENRQLRAQIAALEARGAPAPPIAGFAPYGQPIWFDAVSDAIFITDGERQIRHWNRAAEQIYGWPRAEVLGRLITAIIPPTRYLDDDATTAMQRLRQEGLWRGMVLQRARDGRELVIESATHALIDDQGAPCGYIGVNRDVTERVEAQQALQQQAEALRERDAQLRLAYDAAQIGAWRRDLAAGSRRVQLDARAQIHYGVTSAELALDDLHRRPGGFSWVLAQSVGENGEKYHGDRAGVRNDRRDVASYTAGAHTGSQRQRAARHGKRPPARADLPDCPAPRGTGGLAPDYRPAERGDPRRSGGHAWICVRSHGPRAGPARRGGAGGGAGGRP